MKHKANIEDLPSTNIEDLPSTLKTSFRQPVTTDYPEMIDTTPNHPDLDISGTMIDAPIISAEELPSTIDTLIRRAAPINYSEEPATFVLDAFDLACSKGSLNGMVLAALFDLSVTAYYLERVPTAGWKYCDSFENHRLVYPFVNACPTCTLNGAFKHLRSGKPESAAIGKVTSTILSAFLDLQAKRASDGELEVRTLSDNGLVDAILVGPKLVGLFEIKSAPLIAFPLAMPSNPLTSLNEDSGEIEALSSHSEATVPPEQAASILVNGRLKIPVGSPHSFSQKNHYKEILNWLAEENNFEQFIDSWTETFDGYANPKKRNFTHWLTNGCGTPRPRPENWPKRKSSGYESISDGKSSVGLDRTDDLKKGIYQVLKISTHYKEFMASENRKIVAALVSNIHAVKHHSNYLRELEDIIWTIDGDKRSHVISRDDNQTTIKTKHLHNLFDSLICFTQSNFRSGELKDIYDLGQ